jgi:hypothetical protein
MRTRLGEVRHNKTTIVDWSASRVTDDNASELAAALEAGVLEAATLRIDPSVKELNFDGADLTDNQFDRIMKGIIKYPQFTKISLRFNLLTDCSITNIVSLIEKNMIASLDISGNDSIANSQENIQKLITALKNNKNAINFSSELSITSPQQSVQETDSLNSHGGSRNILLNNSKSLPKIESHTSPVFDEKTNSPPKLK